jgi:hypothetical protein
MFKFSIGMLMDIKMNMRSTSDIPLGLKQDWQEYFDSLDHSSFFTCAVRCIQYIEKWISDFIQVQNTISFIPDDISSE